MSYLVSIAVVESNFNQLPIAPHSIVIHMVDKNDPCQLPLVEKGH